MATLDVTGTLTGTGKNTRFQIPWLDYGSTAVPDSHEMILWWALYLWLCDGNYRQAFQRVADHFITTIQFPELESDEENAYKDLFLKHLNYRRELKACADDYLCFGNLFVWLYLPFIRTLICRQCGTERTIKTMRGKYDLQFHDTGVMWTRKESCPKCHDHRPYICKDRADPDISRVRLNRLSPFNVQMAMNPFSQRKEIYWKIPNKIREDVRSKVPIYIEDSPLEFLEAVAMNGDIKFDAESVLHCDETSVSGLETNGWGVPRAISNFRAAWLQQTTNRADQAIALDYTLGMRIFSPAESSGQKDPMQTAGMQKFVQNMAKIIDVHRNDPATFHTAPYPLNYQFCGGEGENLLPPDKLKFRHQEFLNQLGIPLEYHQMNLTTQAAPMALRLFEAAWQGMPALYNQILAWMVKVTARRFGHEETPVVMQRTTIADDAIRKQVLIQLMAANQISPQTALEAFGIDSSDEAKKVFKHQDAVAKLQKEHDEKAQEEQEMAATSMLTAAPTPSAMAAQAQGQQQGAQPGMGGVGGGIPAAPQGSSTIQGMSDQAEQIATQLASMQDYDRKQQLTALRESNPDLHALVKAKLEKVRSQAASQGQQMLLQPPAAGGAPPAAGGAPPAQ